MSDRDFIILYVKGIFDTPEEYEILAKHLKAVNEDVFTKIIILPDGVIEKVERL